MTAINETLAIENVYTLLGQWWRHEIDTNQLKTLQQEPLRFAWTELGGALPTESVEELAIEYCRLFIGPRDHLPPLQSVWQRAELDSETVGSMQEFAKLVGYHTSESILDHLGVQLDLMSYLLRRVRQEPEKTLHQEIADEFFCRHLTWPEPLLAATVRNATYDFYRSLAELTRDFLIAESTRRVV